MPKFATYIVTPVCKTFKEGIWVDYILRERERERERENERNREREVITIQI